MQSRRSSETKQREETCLSRQWKPHWTILTIPLFDFQLSVYDALPASAVEEHDPGTREIYFDRRADFKDITSENNGCQQICADAYLDCGLHSGGHDAVDFSVHTAFTFNETV